MSKINRIIALTLALGGSAAYAEAGVCFRVAGQCRTAAELKDDGVATVRFKVSSLDREDDTTSWGLYAYGVAATPSLAFALDAVLPEHLEGEDAVLTAQSQICAELTTAGIACSRDLLAGAWTTYALPTGAPPFTAAFTADGASETALAASGRFATKRWACREDADGGATEREIACSGRYSTSLRLLYLANAAFLRLTDTVCAETGASRDATYAAASLPACAAAYDAATWLPVATGDVGYVSSNAARLFLQTGGISLYRTGF